MTYQYVSRHILKKIPLFSDLSEPQLKLIQPIILELSFNRNKLIFQEGEHEDGFFIINTGKVKTFKLSFEGNEQTLHIYGPGQTFGDIPILADTNYPNSAMAIENSNILFLPRNKFIDLLSTIPVLSMNMLAELSWRLQAFRVHIEELGFKRVPARLSTYILTLAMEQKAVQNNNYTVTLPISRIYNQKMTPFYNPILTHLD
ncbi:MAG: Crp/Fnr family transcriptional regulator [Desulfobacteraceae bacterium]|nr:Crp/Fnr family transcriptional regulator [Desulfobacteraceae bacterium]